MSDADLPRARALAAIGDEPDDIRLLLLALAEAVTEPAAEAGASPDELDAAQAAIIADARAFIRTCRNRVNTQGETL